MFYFYLMPSPLCFHPFEEQTEVGNGGNLDAWSTEQCKYIFSFQVYERIDGSEFHHGYSMDKELYL